MRLSRRGFTLIELLVVIGIILVLMSIIVIGFRHVNYTSATRETVAELHTCRDLLQEYQNINRRGVIEGPGPQVPDPAATAGGQPYFDNPPLYPVYLDDPVSPPAAQPSPKTFIPISDLGLGVAFDGNQVSGTADMGDKTAGANTARYWAPAVQRTYDVMYVLLRDPKNRALVSAMPPKRIMEAQVAMNGVKTPADISHAVILDGWGNPIIYVPAGGMHTTIIDTSSGNAGNRMEYVVRSTGMFPASQLSTHPVSAADRPFWASAGQDGDFTKGEDNVYSFQE